MANSQLYASWAEQTPTIRAHILKMIHQCSSGHPGGSLSMVEIIYALFHREGVMQRNEYLSSQRGMDRFILSKGHGVPALYAVLALVDNIISEEELMTLRRPLSRLQGHPDRNRLPQVEACTGSLGQGASIAQGLALAYKLDRNPHRIFTLIGDGETQEGQIWELALSAPHYRLDNLTVIIDYNKGQIDGPTREVMNLDPLKRKWEAFGWHTLEVDGHQYQQLVPALQQRVPNRPTCVIAHTIKGKGVSFMEKDGVSWHGVAPSDQELALALAEVAKNTTIGI